jgi:hypothetical protein
MQKAAIFEPKRYSLIEASTKSGKTAGCLVWIFHQAIETGRPGRNYWWLAPVYAQAKIAFGRLKTMLRMSDPEGREWSANEAEHNIRLGNGSIIWFKSGEKPDNLYGEDVYAVVMDEATRCRAEAWHAVRTTVTATKAPIRLIGNVKGRSSWHFKLARKAEAGADQMAYHCIVASDAVAAGVLHQREIDDAEDSLPHDVFRELYFCEPSDDGGNPFGLSAIRDCTVADLGAGPPVAWGFDLGKRRNFTVGIGLNDDGQVCAFQRWQADWRNTRARIRAMVGGTPAFVDSTGVGDPIVEELQRECPQIEGYLFTGPSKQRLMEGLVLEIQHGNIQFPDGPIVAELETFEYVIKSVDERVTGVQYLAGPGMNDDCVDSLAMAVECKRIYGRGVTMQVIEIGDDADDDDEDAMWERGEDWGFRGIH